MGAAAGGPVAGASAGVGPDAGGRGDAEATAPVGRGPERTACTRRRTGFAGRSPSGPATMRCRTGTVGAAAAEATCAGPAAGLPSGAVAGWARTGAGPLGPDADRGAAVAADEPTDERAGCDPEPVASLDAHRTVAVGPPESCALAGAGAIERVLGSDPELERASSWRAGAAGSLRAGAPCALREAVASTGSTREAGGELGAASRDTAPAGGEAELAAGAGGGACSCGSATASAGAGAGLPPC